MNHMQLRSAFLLLNLLLLAGVLAACTQPAATPIPIPPENIPAAVDLPDRCRGDGAVQTWQLLPLQPMQSELLSAYQQGDVIEFQGLVIGQDDAPARLPHRRYILREAAEGITVTLDYQGDPPPLVLGQSYRVIAWADLISPVTATLATTQALASAAAVPDSRGYELRLFDDAGLLFLGLTDVDLADDPSGLRLLGEQGDCPSVTVVNTPCVASRQAQPLRVRWGTEEITLYPGEDGQLAYGGAQYAVSLFRNRRLVFPDAACVDYHEHQRSLRVERIDPPPVLASPPPLTATAPATFTLPITATQPITAGSP